MNVDVHVIVIATVIVYDPAPDRRRFRAAFRGRLAGIDHLSGKIANVILDDRAP